MALVMDDRGLDDWSSFLVLVEAFVREVARALRLWKA
jgi:hypothetical protein